MKSLLSDGTREEGRSLEGRFFTRFFRVEYVVIHYFFFHPSNHLIFVTIIPLLTVVLGAFNGGLFLVRVLLLKSLVYFSD